MAQHEHHVQSHDDLFSAESRKSSAAPLLDSYIQSALKNNQALRAAFDEWQVALESVPQVTALKDPRIEWTHFIEEIQTRTGAQRNRFTLSQEIPWKGKRSHAGQMAENKAESLWWRAVEVKYETIKNVKTVYYEYAYLGQAIRIVEENIRLLYNLESIVQVRIRSGASQGDLLRLQVEIGKLENEAESLQRLRPALDEQLNAILNETSPAARPWPELDAADNVIVASEALQTLLDTRNPMLQKRSSELKEADHHVIHRKLDRRPDFTVGVTYIDTGEASGAVRPSGSGDDPFGITVGVSIPIWRNKIDAGLRQARHHESAVRRIQHQERRNLHAQLELQAYKLEDAARQIALYRDNLIPRSTQVKEITQVEYESGKATINDVIDVERELLTFEKSYWRAVSDYGIHLAHVEALCGGDVQ